MLVVHVSGPLRLQPELYAQTCPFWCHKMLFFN